MSNQYTKNKHCKCGKLITNKAHHCNKCFRSGKNNPSYIDGRTKNTRCLNCEQILINHQAKNQLCRTCFIQMRRGYKHKKTTILKMKKWHKQRRKYINHICKHCHKYFKVISWKVFRIFCSRKCFSNHNRNKKRPLHSYRMIGRKNSNWHGGISKYPYSFEFTQKLKETIRKRDKSRCRVCNLSNKKHMIVTGIKLPIHHIDYNKKNCNESNLITLCKKCHSRTNGNRDYWYAYFRYINYD